MQIAKKSRTGTRQGGRKGKLVHVNGVELIFFEKRGGLRLGNARPAVSQGARKGLSKNISC